MAEQYIVPSSPHDAIEYDDDYSTIQLAFGARVMFFPAMVADIQDGLRQLGILFLAREKDLQVDIPYTYLVAWYVMNFCILMDTPMRCTDSILFFQHFEMNSWWSLFLL